MFNLTPVVKNLLIINVLLFFLPIALGDDRLFIDLFGLRYVFAPTFSPYQFVTHMFIHANFRHLLYNMIGLIVFGPMLEQFWGSRRFLIFYMVCGIGAGFIYSATNFFEVKSYVDAGINFLENSTPEQLAIFWGEYDELSLKGYSRLLDAFERDPDNVVLLEKIRALVKSGLEARINTPMIGASGAIFGILMGFGLLFPNIELMLLFPPIPIKAKYIVTFYGITAVYGALHTVPGDNVAHFAHLGGMIIALIFVALWKRSMNNFR
jgi:membrane associated rhomboid family serine protease